MRLLRSHLSLRPPAVVFAAAALAFAGWLTAFASEPRSSDVPPALERVLAGDLRFSQDDLADLEHGKVVKHTLPAAGGAVAAVGGVRVHAPIERFVDAYRDIVGFKKNASVLEIGRFSTPPRPSDLDGLTITHDDFDLRNCRVGDCDIRLPAADIGRIAKEVDWHRADADGRAAALFKEMLFDHVRAYMAGGAGGRIEEYDDSRPPVRPLDRFALLLKSSPYIDDVVPGLGRHVASYPADPLPGTEDFLYWSKEKFGIAPFISVTHVTLVPEGPHDLVIATTRDVYSSRYFDASLALALAGRSVADPQSFYLFYVNRSAASALLGAFARIRRVIVERRVRSSLDENLRAVRARLER